MDFSMDQVGSFSSVAAFSLAPLRNPRLLQPIKGPISLRILKLDTLEGISTCHHEECAFTDLTLFRFIDGKMIAGQVANITGQETIDGIKVPKFSEPEGKMYRFLEQGSESSQVSHDHGLLSVWSHQTCFQMTDPLVTDPIEDRWVEVGLSDLGPEAGQGLFAKRDIPESTVFAFFGGLRINATHWNATKPYEPNYWIKTDEGDIIHLPEEYGRDTHKYKATLGHKINHSFSKWNCIFHTLDHPRFGPIPAARSTENVRQGTELLCLYEMKFHEGQSWYQV